MRVWLILVAAFLADGASPMRMQEANRVPAAERAEYMAALCKTMHGAKCSSCLGSDSKGEVKFEAVIRGSFSKAGADEALVVVNSDECEPHAMDFGGGVLLRRENGRWMKVFYQPGLVMRNCIATVGPTTLLVCRSGSTHQGSTSDLLAVYRLNGKEFQSAPLLELGDNFGVGCTPPGGRYGFVNVETFDIDMHGSLLVKVKAGESPVMRTGRNACAPSKQPDHAEHFDLLYQRQGDGFAIAPESAAAEKRVRELGAKDF